jgi:phosphatidylglycerophosphate synthase
LIITADAPSSLQEVCGVTLLDRLLREAQRVGYREAVILSATPEALRGEIARPSWPREDVSLEVRPRAPGPLTGGDLLAAIGNDPAVLLVPGDVYCDIRLLRSLTEQEHDTALIDSAPPGFPTPSSTREPDRPPVICGPVRLSRELLSRLQPNDIIPAVVAQELSGGALATIDAALVPAYMIDMRRNVRPFCLAVSPDSRSLVEAIVLGSAQKGTLDIPAYAHGPIETLIVSQLCRTSVSPNQLTIAGFIFGAFGTVCFATGHFVIGLVIALIFGVLDGLDGKLARVKIETTARGEWEHRLDLVLEYSWWLALGWSLKHTARLPSAFFFTAILIGGELLSQAARAYVRRLTGRLLDDLSPLDRFFRLIAGRRNIFVWLLVIGWSWSGGSRAYRLMAVWSMVSAIVQLARAVYLHFRGRRTPAA